MKTEYLTHQEYFKKRASIIEDIKAIGIDILYQKGNNWVAPNGNGTTDKYVINICSPMEKGIDRKTALYHELSHLMWDSFLPDLNKLLFRWARTFIDEHPKAGKFSDEAKTELVKHVVQEYRIIFNIIEDQRIESLTREIWLGTRNMFDKTRDKLGERLIKTLDKIDKKKYAPADLLLTARFNQPNQSIKWAKDIMSDVEGTGLRGSLVCLTKTKPYVDEYLTNHLDNMADYKQEKYESIIEGNELQEEYEKGGTDEELEDIQKKITENNKKVMQSTYKWTEQVEPVKVNNRRACSYSHDHGEMEAPNSEKSKDPEHESRAEEESLSISEELTNADSKELEQMVIESKSDGELDIEDMKSTMEAIGKLGNMQPSHIKNCQRTLPIGEEVETDTKSARVLSRTFTKLAEQYVDRLDSSGSEVNIDGFISNKANGKNDPCMINEQIANGASILISIDGSGSMGNSSEMRRARTLMSTLYKASEKVKNVELVGNVWSSNYDGDVGITQINSQYDCSKISNNHDYLFTPTHEAIIYSAKQLRGRKGRKKLMILITDGLPQYYKNGVDVPTGTLIKMNKSALKKALRITPRIMCIDISGHWKYGEVLQDIFGKRYVKCGNMDRASKFITKEFRKIVQEVMR